MAKTTDARLEALAQAVAIGLSVKQWADDAGVSERTAYRLSKDERFQALVTKIREQTLNETVGLLVASASRAADTLKALLGDTHAPTVRLQAARALLSSVVEIQSHAELNTRMAELEERLDAKSQGPARAPRGRASRAG